MANAASEDRAATVAGADNRWMRLLYMVIFAIIGYALFWLMLFLAAVHFVLVWINGRPNENLRDFTAKVSAYFHVLLDFLTYTTDLVPYPLSPLDQTLAAAAPAAKRRAKPAPRARRTRGKPKADADDAVASGSGAG